ncbi:MAG: glycosyltransferase [Pirellulaceae bacterium]|nr:glycosyltransferase [Pirellulaceae bacterium]
MNHRPLRIQFVVTSLPVGGAETLLLNLVRGMDRHNFAPEVVCLKEPGELGQSMSQHVPVHSRLIGSKWDVGVVFRLQRLFKQRQADAVITVGAGDKMFWGRLGAKLAGVPVICSALHSTGWPDGVGRLNRLLTSITSGFIAVATPHAEYLVKKERFPAERVFMIPNGVDVDRFVPQPQQRPWLRRELGVPLDAPLVGIVAALREEKNHEQFVQAAAGVLQRFPNAHWVIVGDGPQRSKILMEIERTGHAERFHLLGSRQDTPQVLAGLDVFCLTSRNEANPVSILEALACGIPVVSPDVGSISQTVQPGRTGILTKPLDAGDTCQAICQLLQDPEASRQLGVNGRQMVSASWSLQAMIEGYQHLIQRLYNQQARRCGRPEWTCRSQPHTISKLLQA